MPTDASQLGFAGATNNASGSTRPKAIQVRMDGHLTVIDVSCHDAWFLRERSRLLRNVRLTHPDVVNVGKSGTPIGNNTLQRPDGKFDRLSVGSGPTSNFQRARRALRSFLSKERLWYGTIGLEPPTRSDEEVV